MYTAKTKNANCDACSTEVPVKELRVAKLSSFGKIKLCNTCYQADAGTSYKQAVDMLKKQ